MPLTGLALNFEVRAKPFTMKRSSTAIWQGTGKDGSGEVSLQSKLLENAPYSYGTRFLSHPGTNPEELIAAAHASCFSMKLAFMFNEAGFKIDTIHVTSTVSLEDGLITESHLEVDAKIPQIASTLFDQITEKAKKDCAVSKALNVNITMNARLLNEAQGKKDPFIFSQILI
jgi:lipoyl-dependent peroxiredoxin